MMAINAALAERHITSTGKKNLTDFLIIDHHDGTPGAGKCEWTSHVMRSPTQLDKAACAWIIAQAIMAERLGLSTQLYNEWRKCALTDTRSTAYDAIFEAVSKPVFGTRSSPGSQDHLLGHIGEWMWHIITGKYPSVVQQNPPKPSVTDAGGDGYTIYKDANGELKFRLWESKKETGSNQNGPTISARAGWRQLESKGLEYVAKIASSHSPGTYGDKVDQLMSDLLIEWNINGPRTGVGVTVATHHPIKPTIFNDMASDFPLRTEPGQLRGFAVSVDTLIEVAEQIREYVWSGS